MSYRNSFDTNNPHIGKYGPSPGSVNSHPFWHQCLSDKIGAICGKYALVSITFPIDPTKPCAVLML